MKQIERMSFFAKQDDKYIYAELSALLELAKTKCPHFVDLYDVWLTTHNIYFIMQYCNGEDLENLIKKSYPGLDEMLVKKYLKEFCKGYKILIEKKIIHRDIKPANLMIHDDILKIGDFGMSRIVENPPLSPKFSITKLGTHYFDSPQILREDTHYTNKTDVWSFGVTLYLMCYGQRPYKGETEFAIYKEINKECIDFKSKKVDPILVELMKKMLKIKEFDRISWEDIFKHPYINI